MRTVFRTKSTRFLKLSPWKIVKCWALIAANLRRRRREQPRIRLPERNACAGGFNGGRGVMAGARSRVQKRRTSVGFGSRFATGLWRLEVPLSFRWSAHTRLRGSGTFARSFVFPVHLQSCSASSCNSTDRSDASFISNWTSWMERTCPRFREWNFSQWLTKGCSCSQLRHCRFRNRSERKKAELSRVIRCSKGKTYKTKRGDFIVDVWTLSFPRWQITSMMFSFAETDVFTGTSARRSLTIERYVFGLTDGILDRVRSSGMQNVDRRRTSILERERDRQLRSSLALGYSKSFPLDRRDLWVPLSWLGKKPLFVCLFTIVYTISPGCLPFAKFWSMPDSRIGIRLRNVSRCKGVA